MKHIRILLNLTWIPVAALLCLVAVPAHSQMPQPVKWSCHVEKGKKNEATLVMTATIDQGWHLYSQFLPDGGPIKTAFLFEPAASYKTVGGVEEGKPIDYYDKNFEMQLKYFSHKAVFRQKIQLLDDSGGDIKGTVEFMVCDDQRCLPPVTANLAFELKAGK